MPSNSMDSLGKQSKDVQELVFHQGIRSNSRSDLSVRDVGRYFDMCELSFTSKHFHNLFFGMIRSIHIDGMTNDFFSSWEQILSFLSNCSSTLHEVRLENLDFGNYVKPGIADTSSESDIWETFHLPRVHTLSLIYCNIQQSIKIVKAVGNNMLTKIEIEFRLGTYHDNYDNKVFFSRKLLPLLQSRHPNIHTIELSVMPVELCSFNKPTGKMFENIETLKFTNLTLQHGLHSADLMNFLKDHCRKIRDLTICLNLVSSEMINLLCGSQKKTLRRLKLGHRQLSFSTAEANISDSHVIRIIDQCSKLVSLQVAGRPNEDLFGNTIRGSLTSRWVVHALEKLGHQLEEIGFSFIDTDKNTFQRLGRDCPNLKSLSIKDCTITGPFMEEFSTMFSTVGSRIEELNFDGLSRISNAQIEVLKKELASSSLRVLRLCQLKDGVSFEKLVDLIEACGSKLHILNIFGDYVGNHNPVPILQAVMKTCDRSKLKTLAYQAPIGDSFKKISDVQVLKLEQAFDQLILEDVPDNTLLKDYTIL